jgi:hypothetical protein
MLYTELYCIFIINLNSITSFCPDSLSALQSLESYTLVIMDILSVVFVWVPGNVAANAPAKKAAFHGDLTFDSSLGSDVCAYCCYTVFSSWQDE